MSKAVVGPVCKVSGEKVLPPPVGSSVTLPTIIPCPRCGGIGWLRYLRSELC